MLSLQVLVGTLVVRVQAVKPIELGAYCLFSVVSGVDVLWSELWLHGVDEDGGAIIAPFLELSDVESYEHASTRQCELFEAVWGLTYDPRERGCGSGTCTHQATAHTSQQPSQPHPELSR
jgi:hypothetical protein